MILEIVTAYLEKIEIGSSDLEFGYCLDWEMEIRQ